jgi:hypothetical protein
VPEVAQQPPEPLGAADVAVRDDEGAGADAGSSRSGREIVCRRERVSSSRPRRRGQIQVDVEEARTRDVSFQVDLTSAARVVELPPAVDELVARVYQSPVCLSRADAGPTATVDSSAKSPSVPRTTDAIVRPGPVVGQPVPASHEWMSSSATESPNNPLPPS